MRRACFTREARSAPPQRDDPGASQPRVAGSLLEHYGLLESASEQMLDAARTGDWDRVCRLEAACTIVVARLRLMASQAPLTEAEQPERLRILRAILSNDAEIRRISQPWPALLESGVVARPLH